VTDAIESLIAGPFEISNVTRGQLEFIREENLIQLSKMPDTNEAIGDMVQVSRHEGEAELLDDFSSEGPCEG